MLSSSDLAQSKVSNPCTKDCYERNIFCHSTCDRYITYRAELELMKDHIAHTLADEKEKKEYAMSAVYRMRNARR